MFYIFMGIDVLLVYYLKPKCNFLKFKSFVFILNIFTEKTVLLVKAKISIKY